MALWLLPLLCPLAAGAEVKDVDKGNLAQVGEDLGGARVARIERHPEFERMHLRLADDRLLTVELTPRRSDAGAVCAAGSYILQPRWELLGEAFTREEQPAYINALCTRLATRAPAVTLPAFQVPKLDLDADEVPVVLNAAAPPDKVRPGPLHGLIALLLGAGSGLAGSGAVRAGGSAYRRLLEPLGFFILALLLRLTLSPRTVFIGPDAGYERLVLAWGGTHPLYGGGYGATMAAGQVLTGWQAEGIFATNLLLSAAAVPLLWWIARTLAPPDLEAVVARVAGLGLATLPVALRLAGTEVMHVSVATWELAAVAGLLAFTHRGRAPGLVVAVAGAALAAHTRPEALPMAALPAAAWLSAGGRKRAVLVAISVATSLALVAGRVAELWPSSHSGAVTLPELLQLEVWLQSLTPRWSVDTPVQSFQVFLCLTQSPVLLLVAAPAALDARTRGPALLCLGWWALCQVPVLPKGFPLADAWRLQLPGQAPLVVLAGLGAGALALRSQKLRRAAPLLAGLGALPYLPSVHPNWASHTEWRLLDAAIATLPPGATVLYDDRTTHADRVGSALAARGPHLQWLGTSAALADTEGTPWTNRFALIGVSCVARAPGGSRALSGRAPTCEALRARCTLVPVLTEVVQRTDLDLRIDAPVPIGIFRVDSCEGA